MGIDAALAALAFFVALVLRFDGPVPEEYWSRFLHVLPLLLAVVLVCNLCCGVYRQIWRHASIHEAQRVIAAMISSCCLLSGIDLAASPHLLPYSVVFTGSVLAGAMSGAVRFQSRLFALRRRSAVSVGKRVLLVGAGEEGAALIADMLRSSRDLLPIALLDDDPRKRNRSCHGIPVVGGIDDLVDTVADLRVDQVVLCVPSATSDLVRRVADLAEAALVPLRVLPAVSERVNSQATLTEIRELRIEDLLGRTPVVTDLAAVRQLLLDRRVLITGAGGSVGSEIARQVAGFSPSQLFLLDHDETHLHDTCATLPQGATQLLADIRDGDAMLRLFLRCRPEIVFHAAAHKHVPVLETHAAEAIRTNVFGTMNVLAAAGAAQVDRLVFISTDKAVRPQSVMGASKRLCEQLVLRANRPDARYCAVRFGNVLGSRGSVVPTFVRQIARGGPITVTDARMTRFFMSTTEAVQLVLQAAVGARGGEVFMLEMGEPVRIMDLAERMIRLAGLQVGDDIEIRITGTRPGEKLFEELRTSAETPHATEHPSISRLWPARLAPDVLDASLERLAELQRRDDDAGIRQVLLELAWADEQLDDAAPGAASIDLVDLTEGTPWSRSTT
ncbi:MAG: polysaccharide biosynthesis protein [Mycobacteriales bacterium]